MGIDGSTQIEISLCMPHPEAENLMLLMKDLYFGTGLPHRFIQMVADIIEVLDGAKLTTGYPLADGGLSGYFEISNWKDPETMPS